MKRWYSYSSDPNNPIILKSRRKAITSVRSRSSVNDRVSYLCSLAKGKRVLDIGVVAHTINAEQSSEWLHQHLCNVARSCLGVDILEGGIKQLQAKGYNVLKLDITTTALNQEFDLIVCGELIEHLDTPGALFGNLAKMLAHDGKVIVTTPNPWYINVLLKNIFEGQSFTDSADHIAWFDPSTLYELGQRHQLQLEKYTSVTVKDVNSLKAKLVFSLTPLFTRLGVRPELFAKTLIYEFVRCSENNI